MGLNVNTISPASLKAKNVATEQYVDTEIANIDISSSITSNNDVFAQRLGYANYAAMVAAASSGQTIINGGYINTSLIQATSVLANDIMSKNITYTGTITGGNASGGGIIQSYDGKMIIDLVNGSLHIK